jgi:lipoyl(octanoyl) transferase
MQIIHLGQVPYAPTYAAMQAFTQERGRLPALNKADELWICEHSPVFTQGLAGKPEHVYNAGDIPLIATDRGGQVTYHGPGQVVAYPLMDLKAAGYFVKEYVYRIEEAVIKTLAHFGVTGHRVAGAPGIYVRLDDPFSHARWESKLAGGAEMGVRSRLPERGASAASSVDRALTPIFAPHTNFSALENNRNLTPIKLMPDFTGLGKIAALGIKVSRHCTYHGVALNVAMDLEPYSRINPCGYVGLKTVDLSTIGVSVTWQEAADVLSQKLVTYLAP